jgi:uncharacterized protein (DUF1499 family)
MKTTLPLIIVLSITACGCSTSGDRERFAPCPDSPNCVSSLSDRDDTEHYISAFNYKSHTQEEAKETLSRVLSKMERVRPVTLEENYRHYVFISRVMRFQDDIEFLFPDESVDTDNTLIQIRSASRLGHSDLGVNRKRMEEIRSLWQKELDVKN